MGSNNETEIDHDQLMRVLRGRLRVEVARLDADDYQAASLYFRSGSSNLPMSTRIDAAQFERLYALESWLRRLQELRASGKKYSATPYELATTHANTNLMKYRVSNVSMTGRLGNGQFD